MKSEQDSKNTTPIAIALIAIFALWLRFESASHAHTNLPDERNIGASSQLQKEDYLGELGRSDTYVKEKQFWGDDTISQKAKGIADQIGERIKNLENN